MTRRIEYRRLAREEYDLAANWYETERAGLGDEFAAEIQVAIDAIAEYPDRFPRVESNMRQAPVIRFLYSIFYRVRDELVIVIAVFHNARDPADWQSRS